MRSAVSCNSSVSHAQPITNVSEGDVYEFKFSSTSKVFFRGTVRRRIRYNRYAADYNNDGVLTSRNYKQITFKDVIKELGRKWYKLH